MCFLHVLFLNLFLDLLSLFPDLQPVSFLGTVAKVTGEVLARGDIMVNFDVAGGTNRLFAVSFSKFVLPDSFIARKLDKRGVCHLRRGFKGKPKMLLGVKHGGAPGRITKVVPSFCGRSKPGKWEAMSSKHVASASISTSVDEWTRT